MNLLQEASNHRQPGNLPVSAGGINAALLGVSSAADVDLGGLRDLWLTPGLMDTLLRDPQVEKTPRSLMQGHKVLFSKLDDGIKEFYQSARKYTPDPQATTSPEKMSANAGIAAEGPKVSACHAVDNPPFHGTKVVRLVNDIASCQCGFKAKGRAIEKAEAM